MKPPPTRVGVSADNLDFDGSQFVTSDSKEKLAARDAFGLDGPLRRILNLLVL